MPGVLRSGWAALALFVVVSVVFTLPLAGRLPDTLPDWNDAADSTWRIGTISRNLLADPLHLYRTPALYPLAGVPRRACCVAHGQHRARV